MSYSSWLESHRTGDVAKKDAPLASPDPALSIGCRLAQSRFGARIPVSPPASDSGSPWAFCTDNERIFVLTGLRAVYT